MLRVTTCLPPPQVLVHVLQELHEPTAQSTGHESLPQVRVALSAGHTSPLCCMAISTLRVWVCEPPPHECVHALQAPNAETSQSIGQATTVQAVDCADSPHATPP